MTKLADLQPGPELDRLVHIEVLGLDPRDVMSQECVDGVWSEPITLGHNVKAYSSDMNAAWEVVEKLKAPYEGASLSTFSAFVENLIEYHEGEWDDSTQALFNVFANLTPYDICIAALKAKGIE